MTEDKTYVEFRNYLKEIISHYHSQAEFASACDLSVEYVNRLLNNQVISQPRKKTLQKIAGHSKCGITVKMLMNACGYNAADKKDYSFREENKEIADLILSGLQDALKNPPVRVSSIQDFLSCIDMVLKQYEISYTFEEVPEYNHFFETENGVILSFSWKSGEEDVVFTAKDSLGHKYRGDELYLSFDILVLYDQTASGTLLISDILTSQKDLLSAGSQVAEDIMEMEQYKEDGICLTISFHKKNRNFRKKNKQSAEERLLKAIFGEEDEKPKRISTVEGIGFYLSEKSLSAIPSFVKKHESTLDLLYKKEEKEKLLQRLSEDGIPVSLYCSLVEKIIFKETDIVVGMYMDYPNDENGFDNTPCVILEKALPWEYSDTEKELTKESLVQILDLYARQLHTEVTDCYYVTLIPEKKEP